jgi:PhnB protein
MSDDHNEQGPTGGVTPHLTIPSRGGQAASEFYQRAFAATELTRKLAEDGERLMHCHLRINGASVMLNDEFPEYHGEADIKPRGRDPAPPGRRSRRVVGAGAGQRRRADPADGGPVLGRPIRPAARPFGHLWSIGGPAKR